MKRFSRLNCACLLALPLIVTAAPPVVMAQAQGAAAAEPATQAVSPGPNGAKDQCSKWSHSMEQIEERLRNIDQELQDKLAYLQEAAVQEVEMSSPELGKLQDLSAQLDRNLGGIEERAQELSAHAAEIAEVAAESASQIAEQEPGIVVRTSEDGGGWLGVEIDEVSPERAKDLKLPAVRGVIVLDVEPDSPAAKAGLKEDDVITQYNGQTVEGTVQFRRLVRETPPGHSVTLGISRDGGTQSVTVELGDRSAYFEKRMKTRMRDFGEPFSRVPPNYGPQFAMPNMPEVMDGRMPVLGISAEDLTGQLGAYFGAPDNAGVLVREVRPDTAAEKAGLKAGDVIVKVNETPVHSLDELREQLRKNRDQKSVNFGILRRGSELSVAVAVERPRPGDVPPGAKRAEDR
ncbi:MAG TPA: PDZ domain-containing protein [Candidatus Sulfotelmatobacter sp.]|nr:PDZ domain-containing protein [Candidatus Sulfotelmatobacter sp.]